ncbi:hypothetical protein BOTCAL_0337g00110 [Botryotinia calthae]|uniref:Uncharacterized protein n=1 Tax=Botryotinia calthae TaxID=38488 RepID=A0A4Y8CT11_9HELO|nr:hypothetical protein BOTCAL_0337g00110 [Botryotinia calthae]
MDASQVAAHKTTGASLIVELSESFTRRNLEWEECESGVSPQAPLDESPEQYNLPEVDNMRNWLWN